MTRLFALLGGTLLHLSANAADVVPRHLTGTWGTGASLYDGKEAQTDVYIFQDGYGIMAGSTAPAYRADGADDGKPGPRALIGWPVRAKMDGETLLLRPFLPEGVPGMKGEIIIPCHYGPADQTLTCTMPEDKKPLVVKRRSETVPAEVEKMLDQAVPKEQR